MIPAAPGASSVGLSRGHISPYRAALGTDGRRDRAAVRYYGEVAWGGRLVRVRARVPVKCPHRPWKRGHVAGFSQKSRGRLLRLTNSIDMGRHRRRPVFLTLTYPEAWPGSPAQCKRHLDSLWKRMCRGWLQTDRHGHLTRVSTDNAAAIWRIEEQERGAPHFHLIIFGLRHIDRYWIGRAWAEVVESGDPKHERAGTRVEYPDYWEKAGSYVAKYIAKQAKGPPEPDQNAGDAEYSWAGFHSLGRAWGVLGRKNLPTDLMEYELPEWAFEAVKEILVELRDDDRREEWHATPYRGIWGTCGPGPVQHVLRRLDELYQAPKEE